MLRDNTSIDLVALVPNEAYIWVKGLRCLVTGGLGKCSQERIKQRKSQINNNENSSFNYKISVTHPVVHILLYNINKHLIECRSYNYIVTVHTQTELLSLLNIIYHIL